VDSYERDGVVMTRLVPAYHEHGHLEKDPLADERVCANEVCGCRLPGGMAAGYCCEYCRIEFDRTDGTCQCGHIPCA
jgi:hypothetical protein